MKNLIICCRIAMALFWTIWSLMLPLGAGTFDERHAHDLAANPADVDFRLSVGATRNRFHMGETIPITLEFSSSSPDKYKLKGAVDDRSGRLPTEEFVLERADVADPYQDYFGIGVLGGNGGGSLSGPVLTADPYRIELQLNDWFRFDSPGRYRLYLKSHRARARVAGETGDSTVPFAPVSNIIEIEILPRDFDWEATKLAEVGAILDPPDHRQPKAEDPPSPFDAMDQKTSLARKELRFLGTHEAVRLMLEDARLPGRVLDVLTLIGARDRADTILELDRYLADPHVGIGTWDIEVRALFTLVAKDAPKPIPLLRWQFSETSLSDSLDVRKVRATVEARQKRFKQIVQEETERLIPLIEQKDAANRKTSAEAIAALAPEVSAIAGLIPPADYGLSRQQLISQFLNFPPERQSEILNRKWDLVRGPEIIPVLRELIEKTKPKTRPPNAFPLEVWGSDVATSDAALRRLTELSPPAAESILRKDIASGKPRFPGFAVRQFAAVDMPEADGALGGALKTDLKTALPLVAKFGTVRLASQMGTLYASDSWPCVEEAWFTTYFIRTLPGDDPGEGKDILRRAMADREHRGCYRTLLTDVARTVWNPAIETVALDTLNDPDPDAAASAASALAANGGRSVERFLWKRLERWSAQWKGRATELQEDPITGKGPTGERQLGSALFGTIGSAKSWLLDEPRRKHLLALCVEEWCREDWARPLVSDGIPVEASSGGEVYPSAFTVGGYTASTFQELKAKLQQFQAGTNFFWCSQDFNPFDTFSAGQRLTMLQELGEFLSKLSMSIEPGPDEKCRPGPAVN